MYPRVTIKNGLVSIDFSIIDQLINAKPGGIKFRLDQVESVDVGPQIFKEIRGLRAPGTYAFVLIGGTYWRSRKNREFWNARKKLAAKTIRIRLTNHFYSSVVIQVADPETLKSALLSSLKSS